jgi:DNA ligase 1
MYAFSQLCESIGATTKKLEKVRLVADYLRATLAARQLENAALGALYLCGTVFPRREERVLSIGFSVILKAVASIVAKDPRELGPILRHHGDIGAGAEEILADHRTPSSLKLSDVAEIFDALARQRGPAGKQSLFEDTLRRLSALEAKYFIKICTGELRIGLKENLVEEAIAQCFEQPPAAVQRANMLTGDISETFRLANAGRLAQLQLELFRPISVMLASPVDTPAELVEVFPSGALVEEKFDGIRAQVHKRGDKVEMYSRTLDRVTEFPELAPAIRSVPGDFILDGEIIGWRDGRAIPFTELQQRLGRKQIDLFTATMVPVCFVAFDLLLLNGESLLDFELAERRLRMMELLSVHERPHLQYTRAELCTTVEEIESAFVSALAKGNEGLIAKSPQSPYVPGRRGQFWIKLKRPLATLDVVVTAAEYGHGKRRGLLSDYTFAVRNTDADAETADGPSRFVNIGKAYSGVTDAEIAQLTALFLAHTIEDHGHVRTVDPVIVMEVAFNNVRRSNRHDSGFALRFPRIVRLRDDKPVQEIDTLHRVREIFARQQAAPRSGGESR